MDTSALKDQLAREIREQEIARSQLLADAVTASEKLRELAEQQEFLVQLEGRSLGEARPVEDEGSARHESANQEPERDDADAGQESKRDEADDHKGLRVRWPLGPHYQKKAKGKKVQAWARYKLGAADWYLSVLHKIDERTGKLDRYLGVEMAIDGAVQSICGAFDAAVHALTGAVELAMEIPTETRTPAESASWSKVAAEAKLLGLELESASRVSAALNGEHSDPPVGWLARLQLLRGRSSRQDLLIRHWSVGGTDPGIYIDVPGAGPQPPLAYLENSRNLVEELLELILRDVDAIRQTRPQRKSSDQFGSSGDRELPNLLRRAQVQPPN